jgi:hypothetical protein
MACSVATEEGADPKELATAPLQVTFHLLRPDKLRGDLASALGDSSFRYDGSAAIIFNTANGTYAALEQTGDLDAVLSRVAELSDLPALLVGLLGNDAFEALVTETGTNDARYVGREDLDNRLCHHLTFRSPTVDWELWMEVGDPPLPRKLLVDPKRGQGEARYLVQIRSWDVSPEFTEDFFVFEPSAEMRQPAGLTGILSGADESP